LLSILKQCCEKGTRERNFGLSVIGGPAHWLSNRIFKSFDDIVDHCCYAWNTLIDQPWKIMSIARRDWAAAGHSI
jgi:hypothetical protein